MSSKFAPDERVRVNWQRKGKYYDARITAVKESGYVVEYFDSQEVEEHVREKDIIGMLPSLLFLPPCSML